MEALLFLAVSGKEENGIAISQATGIPPGYLAQLMMPLRKAGIVSARRGAEGGYTLTRRDVTAKEVLAVSEAALHIPCGECSLQNECATEKFWTSVQKTVDKVTGSVTLAELAKKVRLLGMGSGI